MDGSRVRTVAAGAGELAEETRRLAGQVQAIGGVEWHSAAAEALRRRLGEEAVRLRGLAASLDGAREEVLHHAAALERGPGSPLAGALLGAGAVLR